MAIFNSYVSLPEGKLGDSDMRAQFGLFQEQHIDEDPWSFCLEQTQMFMARDMMPGSNSFQEIFKPLHVKASCHVPP